jgi:tight adherence protein C
MGAELIIPIAISLAALLIADSESFLLGSLSRKSMNLEDRTQVKARLAQLGRPNQEDNENFRLAQFVLIATHITFSTIALIFQVITLALYIMICVAGILLVIYCLEKNLSNRCKRRLQRIESEFPSLIEMLTLAAGAGESPISSLKRIALRANGHLAVEIREVITSVERGSPFSVALDEMSYRIGSTSVRRFVDSMIISLSRGTSLVETLSHNVQESRNQERVRLLSAAGKAEISMMIPVVFLILPISILFALFPSITALNFYGN